MATEKVGIYRNYYGPVPRDSSGKPFPKIDWPKKRAHSWVVRWFGSDGQRYGRSFKTRKEAERCAKKKQEQIGQGKADPPKGVSFVNFVTEHAQLMKGQVARATLADQMRALRMFMEHIGETTWLRSIKPRHAESFISVRLASARKIGTVNKDIRTLKRVFNLAIEPRGYLMPEQNPFARIKQRKQSAKSIRYITAQEFRKLLGAASTLWWKAFLSVAYTTAARKNEIVNLTWADVDFEQNRIRITSKQAGASLSDWEPKDHEGRILPAPAGVLQLLVDLQLEAPEGCPYVFVPTWRWHYIQKARKCGRWNQNRALLNNLNRKLTTLQKKAGLAKFSYHDLRRSCITNWAKHLPAHVVRKLAGHSDIKTTLRYYLSVQEDDLEKARQIQSQILESDPTDQILTNSDKNDGFSAKKRKGHQA